MLLHTCEASFDELLDGPAAALANLTPYVPAFRFVLTDLAAVPDAQLRGTALAEVGYLLLKHIRDGDFAARLGRWTELLRRVAAEDTTGFRGLCLVIEYILQASDIAIGPLTDLIREAHPDMQELIETTAERLRQEGKAEGKAEGRLEGQAAAVVRVLEARGVELPAAVREQILACRDEGALDRWLDRAARVAAVAELFVDDADR